MYDYVKCVLFDIQFNDTLIELPLRYVRKIQLPLFSDATGKFCSTFHSSMIFRNACEYDLSFCEDAHIRLDNYEINRHEYVFIFF